MTRNKEEVYKQEIKSNKSIEYEINTIKSKLNQIIEKMDLIYKHMDSSRIDSKFNLIEDQTQTELLNTYEKIKQKKIKIGIIGLGRVGLPLALSFANSKINVIGLEKNKRIIEKVNKCEAPFKENLIEEYLTSSFRKKTITVTDDERELNSCNVIIITVGTPLSKNLLPDYSQIYSALEILIKLNLKGKMIILRSTSSPETLENIIKPYLEKNTNLIAGKDFGLAVCPERIAEGHAIEEIKNLPEIVGGINNISSEIVKEVFKIINPEKEFIFLTPKGAALAKLFTNIYRYVNFALANEFAIISEIFGEDCYKIIKAANYKYSRANIPKPGPTGGPCLSKDGYYLRTETIFPDFIKMAWFVNESIPNIVVDKLVKKFESRNEKIHGKKIAILGVAYKAEIDDVRESPSLRIIELLKGLGAEISVYDPYVSGDNIREYGIKLTSLEDSLDGAEGIIIATNHKEFNNIYDLLSRCNNSILFDCWGMLDETKLKNIEYLCFGKAQHCK